MSSDKLYRLDGVLWMDELIPTPYCPRHRLEMDPWTYDTDLSFNPKYDYLRCEECEKDYKIPRDIKDQQTYIRRKLDSRELTDIKVLNLDDEAIPIAENKMTSKDGKFFVRTILMKSKVGQRLVIYAGERGKKEKTQIFVEPLIKRLAFDQNDIHPSEVFLKLEATFEDGTSSSIVKLKQKSKKSLDDPISS